MRFQNWHYLAIMCIMSTTAAKSEQLPDEVSNLYDGAGKLILEYYPKAKIEKSKDGLIAKFDTRTFMIHHPLMNGEWQEARPQEGPNPKGIQCDITSQHGEYMGQAVVPQAFNNRYFESLLMAPYNKGLDRHLIVHLDYPARTPPEFCAKFQKLMNSFATQTK